MKITIEEEDKDKASRLIRADEAFMLLSDIDQKCREIIKYHQDGTMTRDEALQLIRDMIHEDNLLDLWT